MRVWFLIFVCVFYVPHVLSQLHVGLTREQDMRSGCLGTGCAMVSVLLYRSHLRLVAGETWRGVCLCSDTKLQAGLASEKRRPHWKDLSSEMITGKGAWVHASLVLGNVDRLKSPC